jgi:hypothetical protein
LQTLPNALDYHHHPASFTTTTITVKQGSNGDVACFLKLKQQLIKKPILHFRNRAKSVPK